MIRYRAKGRRILAVACGGSALLYLAFTIGGCEKENTEPTITPEGGAVIIEGGTSPRNPTTDSGASDDGSLTNPDAALDSGKLACAIDPDCKGGKCFNGVCICDLFLRVQPDGTCGQTPEPACLDQIDAGSRCNSPQPVCREVDAGEISGSAEANRTCGDFAPAVCCFAGCRGPNFVCCGTSGALPQICIQGWRTCRPNEKAALSSADCN